MSDAVMPMHVFVSTKRKIPPNSQNAEPMSLCCALNANINQNSQPHPDDLKDYRAWWALEL